MLTLALTLVVSTPPAALPVDKIEWRRRTLVEFSAVRLRGEVIGPATSYVQGRRTARFRSLIRLRQDFRPELATSVDNL